MPRRSTSQHHAEQNALLVENMLRKQDEYRNGITENHSLAMDLAGRLQHGEDIEKLVGDVEEYRDRLKKLAEHNIQQERQLNSFLAALQQVSTEEKVEDYQSQVDTLMENALQEIEQEADGIEQEEMYREICAKLGEAAAAQQGGDQDLEIVGGQTTVSLKCPITCAYLENPVKHPTCGHVFSRAAIQRHLKSDKRCPVAGCMTQNIKLKDLVPDPVIAREVHRAIKQKELEERALSQQAIDADGEEE